MSKKNKYQAGEVVRADFEVSVEFPHGNTARQIKEIEKNIKDAARVRGAVEVPDKGPKFPKVKCETVHLLYSTVYNNLHNR